MLQTPHVYYFEKKIADWKLFSFKNKLWFNNISEIVQQFILFDIFQLAFSNGCCNINKLKKQITSLFLIISKWKNFKTFQIKSKSCSNSNS